MPPLSRQEYEVFISGSPRFIQPKEHDPVVPSEGWWVVSPEDYRLLRKGDPLWFFFEDWEAEGRPIALLLDREVFPNTIVTIICSARFSNEGIVADQRPSD